jgi:hypothetical protein
MSRIVALAPLGLSVGIGGLAGADEWNDSQVEHGR